MIFIVVVLVNNVVCRDWAFADYDRAEHICRVAIALTAKSMLNLDVLTSGVEIWHRPLHGHRGLIWPDNLEKLYFAQKELIEAYAVKLED